MHSSFAFDMSKQKVNNYIFQKIAYTYKSKAAWSSYKITYLLPRESLRSDNQRHLAASSFSPRPVGRSRPSERATCLIISSKRWPYSDAKSTSDRSISGGEMNHRSYLVTSFLPRVKFTRSRITKIMRLLLYLRAVSVGSYPWGLPDGYRCPLLPKQTFISRLSCISWRPHLPFTHIIYLIMRNY